MLLQTWGGKFIDKMHYDWGYEFQPLRESPYHQAFFPKNGLCTMKDEFDLMNEKVTEAGAEYLFETTFKTLITDGTGAIAGARFTAKDGSIVDIKAKAVALAAGGYISNQEWMMKYAPEYAFIGNIVGGRKGDGIAAGVAAGGTLSGMGPVSNLNPRYEAGHMLATFYPLIALLPNGKRFYCETAVHNAATGCLAAGYNEWYSIWDNTAQNGIDQEVIAHAGDAVQTANSLEELAEKMGMHIETVKAAFENWDTICDNQEDPEFGKTLLAEAGTAVLLHPQLSRALQEPGRPDRERPHGSARRRRQPHPRPVRRRLHRRHRGHRPRRRLRPAVGHHPRRRPGVSTSRPSLGSPLPPSDGRQSSTKSPIPEFRKARWRRSATELLYRPGVEQEFCWCAHALSLKRWQSTAWKCQDSAKI